MLADNEMPDYAELIISDCRKIRAQIIAEQGDNADALLAFSPYTRTAAVIAGLADALDRAQRERDWVLSHKAVYSGMTRNVVQGTTTIRLFWYGCDGESYETEGPTLLAALEGAMLAESQLAGRASQTPPEGKNG